MECILSEFTDDTELGRNIGTLKGSSISQKGLSRLEKWAERDFIKFKGNCQIQCQSVQQYKVGIIWTQSNPAEVMYRFW